MRKKKSAAAAAVEVFLFIICLGALAVTLLLRSGNVPGLPAAAEPSVITAAEDTGKAPPASAPTATPAPAPATPADYSGLLQITELMSRNRSVVQSSTGAFCDWIELKNISSSPVSLAGWTLGTEEAPAALSPEEITLQPGEYTVVFVKDGGSGFTFASGETVTLTDPNGTAQDSVTYTCEGNNTALARTSEGDSFTETLFATPGFENTDAGYLACADSRSAEGPLVISEATVSNRSYAQDSDESYRDIIELKNISSAPVQLSDYYLSDTKSNYLLYRLPEVSLAPGEYYYVYAADNLDDEIHTGFGLNTYNESLYLSDSTHIIDYVFLHDVPVNGSCGRMDGENGFFYFDVPTPGEANVGGCRFVAETPGVSTPAGTYDGVESVTVELTGDGTIYYTTDGSVPTLSSSVYTAPLTLTKNTVIRCFLTKDGYATNRVMNYTYLLNENITLPALCLTVDNLTTFNGVYNAGAKAAELSANLTLYEDNATTFTANCGVSLAGWTSLQDAKKSFNIDFRSRYGDSKLTGVDIFGNGITKFDALCIRTGQDYKFAVIRDELCQDLANSLPDSHIFTQASKYTILYINGEYRGIYALKESICEQSYAEHFGFDVDTVTQLHAPVSKDSEYYKEVLGFMYDNNDFAVEENYEYICSVLDIDNLIDWVIMEGWCANTDTVSNLRYFKSSEDGKWRVAYYDLDWSFWYTNSRFVNVYCGVGNDGVQMTNLLNCLLRNKTFRATFLNRLAECMSTTLTDENALAKIDELYNIVQPEVDRDRDRWYLQRRYFYERIDELKTFITYNGWHDRCIETVCSIFGLSTGYFNETYLSAYQNS